MAPLHFLRQTPFGKALLLACSLLYCTANLAAQDLKTDLTASSTSLAALLEQVRARNLDLKAASLEADVLAQRRAQVTALPDPRLGVSYQPYPLFTARGTQRSQWRVEQALPFPGTLGLKGDIADLGAAIASRESQALEQDLLFETKTGYYELYRVQEQQALFHAFQERLQDFEASAATRYEVGHGMQQAILKAQLERNTLSRRMAALDVQKQAALAALSRLLNTRVEALTVDDLAAPVKPDIDEESLLAIARQYRPEADALDLAKKRTEAEIALAEKAFYPDFGLHATYFDVSPSSIPATATGRDAFAFGVTLNVPLWRNRLRARLEEARLKRMQAGARIEGLEAAFRAQILDLVARLAQEQGQLTLYEDALIPQAETSLQATLGAYASGRTDYLDLLDAERMLFSLHTGYVDAFARYLKASAALERALGITTLRDIEQLQP